MVVVLGTLFGTALFFVVVPTWEAALAGVLLSLPGSMLAGALLIYFQRRWPTKPTGLQQKLKVLAIPAAMTVAAVWLERWVSLNLFNLIVYIAILFLLASLCQRVLRQDQKGNDPDANDPDRLHS